MAFLLDPVFFILELIGTVAFAISGALVSFAKAHSVLVDALGLGLFTVIGIRVAFFAHSGSKVFLCVFVGVVTGVGGGVMRDLFAGNKPYIFVKHFYACASIIGALACVWLWPIIGQTAAMALGAVIVIALRLIAAYRRWELPRAE